MNEVKYLSFRIPKELNKKAKLQVCNLEISMQEWLIGLIEKELEKKVEI